MAAGGVRPGHWLAQQVARLLDAAVGLSAYLAGAAVGSAAGLGYGALDLVIFERTISGSSTDGTGFGRSLSALGAKSLVACCRAGSASSPRMAHGTIHFGAEALDWSDCLCDSDWIRPVQLQSSLVEGLLYCTSSKLLRTPLIGLATAG